MVLNMKITLKTLWVASEMPSRSAKKKKENQKMRSKENREKEREWI